jgi:hypothetical protein
VADASLETACHFCTEMEEIGKLEGLVARLEGAGEPTLESREGLLESRRIIKCMYARLEEV